MLCTIEKDFINSKCNICYTFNTEPPVKKPDPWYWFSHKDYGSLDFAEYKNGELIPVTREVAQSCHVMNSWPH